MEIPSVGASKPFLGRRRVVCVWLCLISRAQVVVVVGPTLATSRQPGDVLSGRLIPLARPCPVAHPFTLNRGGGEGFSPVSSPFLHHRRFPFLLLAKHLHALWGFLGERRAERGRGKTYRSARRSMARCRTGGLSTWMRRCWPPSSRRGCSCRRKWHIGGLPRW